MVIMIGLKNKGSLTLRVEPPAKGGFLGGEEEQYRHNDHASDCV